MNSNDVTQQIQELESLRRQTRRFSLCTVFMLVAIVLAGVSVIISSIYSLTLAGPKQDEFVKQFSGKLEKEVLPAVQRAADPSLKRLKPAVEMELRRLDARAPQLADAALKELEKLGTNLPVRAEAVLDKTVGKTLQAREAKLRQMFPGLYDKQIATLLENLQAETQDQIAKTAERLFNPHLNSIQSILASMEKIQKTEPIDPKAEINPWQVAFLFVDVFTQEFKDLAVVTPVKSIHQ